MPVRVALIVFFVGWCEDDERIRDRLPIRGHSVQEEM